MFPVEIVLTRDSFKRRYIFFSAAKLKNAFSNRTYSVAYGDQVWSLNYVARKTVSFLLCGVFSHIAVTFSYFKNIEFNARKHVNTAHAATRSGLLSTFIAQSWNQQGSVIG